MKKLKNPMKDSLYRNSLFLMIGTGVMAVFGFLFWMICARLFSTEQVGLATTIISVMSLITTFSLLGLNAGLIRYLPSSKRKNEKINTCFMLVGIISIIVTTFFILGINIFSPRLIFIKDSLIISVLFIISMVFGTFNSLIESVFTAYRSTGYVLLKNTIFSVLKIAFPILVVGLGIWGIFGSWMIGILGGVCASFFILIKKFKYKPRLFFHDSIIKEIGKYSFVNYVSGFIGSLPILLLPLMITNSIHPEMTAYFYMAMMVANVLFIIPQAVSSSLFAEGSYNQKSLKEQTKKANKIIALLIIPSIAFTIIFGKYILLLMGKDYSTVGTILLNYLALSCIFLAVSSVFGSIFRVQHKMKELLVISIVSAVSILGLSWLWMSKGLSGIGLAWLIGQGITSLAYLGLYLRIKKQSKKNKE
jgi:O-antigen/teichoic acid export membrane protein